MSMMKKKDSILVEIYFHYLLTRPLLTKSLTAALLGYIQEILARRLAGVPPKPSPYKASSRATHSGERLLAHLQSLGIDLDALKLAGFGGLIAAPSTHALQTILHSVLARLDAKPGQIHRSPSFISKYGLLLGSLLFVSPIQNTIYVVSMAILNGARTVKEIKAAWKRGFPKITKLGLIVGPISGIFASRFLRPRSTFVFFNLLQFSLGLYFNQLTKKIKLKRNNAQSPPSN
ncbi:hypothetical protein CROQUDRAFT_75600 [Cronartium quercuum f. sp. fusiforme G11]|uniref:Uncharacterized protein n=1 Tax=Cronartium quercuum f. sp. fusiforme G11 TaxID=708437 RepID=A0A9P6NMK9_9BASI|nr:hypothetical protein CROQUDRAFT_75600 [Cronartium quercuum f. sp. fusiforme G11]